MNRRGSGLRNNFHARGINLLINGDQGWVPADFGLERHRPSKLEERRNGCIFRRRQGRIDDRNAGVDLRPDLAAMVRFEQRNG